ncbi:hypothetical protein [Tomitella gaofuii]|uniref:hypothetical protein n=1 Tax=Tomitella gaofuii TaxID=2760083 RepID=UPI0015FB944E|nr:hypothetical protein [Tomitella gaofuii]
MSAVGVVRIGSALAVGAVLMAGAACSSSDGSNEPAPGFAGEVDPMKRPATIPPDVPPLVMFNSEDLGPGFDDQQCVRRDGDGDTRLKYTAQRGDDQSELVVGIVPSDPPRLDTLTLDLGQDRWEADPDAPEQAVVVDGNAYRIFAPVSEADGPRTAEIGVLFSCSE